MSYTFRQQLLDPKLYMYDHPTKKDQYGKPVKVYKSAYAMTPTSITVHNTYNDASAKNEANYHNRVDNHNSTSYHVAIDDIEAVQLLPFNRNGYHAGDGSITNGGNRTSIGIEICYSKSGGSRYVQAEENAVKYIAQLLFERGWFVDRVKKHQDFSGKYCPHRILDEKRWDSFKERIAKELKYLIEEDLYMSRIQELEEEVIALNKQMSNLLQAVEKTAVYTSSEEASNYAAGALKWATEVGILKGDKNGNLNPHGALKRQDMALMLQRYHDNVTK